MNYRYTKLENIMFANFRFALLLGDTILNKFDCELDK